MKDNLDIEALFKDKFSSFEGEVSPDAWANIQQGMGAAKGAAAAKAGLSGVMKTVLISGGIIAATVTGVVLLAEEDKLPEVTPEQTVVVDSENTPTEETVIAIPEEMVEMENDGNTLPIESSVDNANETVHSTPDNDLNHNPVVNSEPSVDNTLLGEQNGNPNVINERVEEATNSSDNSNNELPDVDNGTNGNEINDNQPGKESEDFVTGTMTFEAGDPYVPSTYEFHSNAENYKTVIWDFGDGETAEGESVVHTFEKSGEFKVVMTVVGESKIFEENEWITIKGHSEVKGINTNVFSPNGDGKNDYFSVETKEIASFYILIQDKNGNQVFESNNPDFRWDGTDKFGNRLENGGYTFIIIAEGTDGKSFKIPGQITIQ